MTIPGRRFAQTIALAVVVALGWLGGCSDTPGEPCLVRCPPEGIIVSDPIPVPAASLARGAGAAPALGGSAAVSVAYVSLPLNTVPAGRLATIHRVGDAGSMFTTVRDGGFDPVPVEANVGDSIEVLVADAAGAPIQTLGLMVAARRPPIVVRTDPPRKKTDVPLNAAMVVVFSEPVAGETLTPSSVQLFRAGTPVDGSRQLLEGTTTSAVFVPASPLEPNTDYRLVVTRAVRDLTGDALAADATVEFTTGTTTVGQAYSVLVVPDTTALPISSQVQLIAVARDSLGEPVSGRPVVWSSENPALATVSATGLVTALAQGEARVRAEVDGLNGVAVIHVSGSLAPIASVVVVPESATAVVSGFVQLTAVLRDAGGNILSFRAVTWQTSAPAVVGVNGGSGGKAVVTGVSTGTATITATSEGKSGTARITVGTVGPFTQIWAGGCALATDGAAWCWGSNGAGQLGNGTVLPSTVPTAVAGGLRFARISGTCALTVDSIAYCWGPNWSGALGIGTAIGPEECPDHGSCSTTPVAVTGGLRFSAIDFSVLLLPITCALAQSGDAYCWGNNESAPAKVTGGFTFTAVTAGPGHACALTERGAAYCWGSNNAGQLGDGTTSTRISPVPVVGGHTFVALSAGYDRTCGVASDGIAYCWGRQGTSSSWVPVPVAGALTFGAISVGIHRTCALTSGGLAYCWGATPVAVEGGLVFATLDSGADVHANDVACGVTTSGVAYCWDGSNVPVKVPGQP